MALFKSSTQDIPEASPVPRHIAVIMDGNGRWAKKRFMPRVMGHKRGVETVRDMVKQCIELGVEYLTLFAFSSENWRRPPDEVKFLMGLFMEALKREVVKLHENQIRLVMIGDRSRFDPLLLQEIHAAEKLTEHNRRLTLTIAANYGGRWDIMQAARRLVHAHPEKAETFSEEDLSAYLSMHYAPEPDLFIRTGGEQRISNFLLWQLAYAELYFTDTLWPDFDREAFMLAVNSYRKRERRFGRTSEQLTGNA
ncbi:undecaprenyl diphosphate synthase [Novimethylophilus kurashikiensis]|uniref:Isoprenyl transferase n=1 Tax=Novimethylophilus kurashikiensis TaxID=1825523 RepID=A0A2R5F3D9_9PROT|nr:isoprenyl transferase [Novimethylophilus kurashikiensis]GBG13012.1 undecaprenyl diphosphate synthase [Novimethylophilus kurashikiensis]